MRSLNVNKKWRPYFYSFLCISALACGTSEDDETSEATTGDTFNEQGFLSSAPGSIQIQMTSTGSSSSGSSLTATDDDKYYSLRSIISGSPDDMVVKVTKITLKNTSGGEIPLFSNTSGKELRIRGTTVDLSEFFTKIQCMDTSGNVIEKDCPCGGDASGNPVEKVDYINEEGATVKACPKLEEGQTPPVALIPISQTGTFSEIGISILNEAKIKGCVSGYVQQTNYDSGTSYTDNVNLETYCTKASASMETARNTTSASSVFTGSGSSDAGWSSSLITLGQLTNTENVNFSFPIKDNFTITNLETDKPKITMVIDTSRMLRFFKHDSAEGRDRPDGGPEVGTTFKGSYFFINGFGNQSFVYIGRAGTVKGFQLVADSYRLSDSGDSLPDGAGADQPELYTCTKASTCNFYYGGWLSAIYDYDGTLQVLSIQSDDNNIGMKATNKSAAGIDTSVFSESNSLHTMNLNTTDAANGSWLVQLYKLNLASELSATSTAHYHFKYTQSGGETSQHYGKLTLTRRL